jgi:transposase
MDGFEQLRDDLREGRIDPHRLIDLLVCVQRQLQATTQQLQATTQQLAEAKQRIEELEKNAGVVTTAKVDAPFSVRSEEKRQEARRKNKRKQRRGRRGRHKSQDKIARAERTEAVYPKDVPASACRLSHVRPVWRLIDHRAVLVAYQVYRGPKSQYGQIPGVLGRSEFGLEIIAEVAYLVYSVGLSFDKVCALLHFFQELDLRKGQVDALLYQLSRHWEREFDALCTLLAKSLVVHGDETRWSLNSVWALLSEKARVLLFGVHKDADTLRQVLDPATFAGIVFSDDAAVYETFSRAQKCWAHLLRKAIKLTLQDPSNSAYRDFTDRLLAIYQKARRLQRDQRFSAAGRSRKVGPLEDELFDLCAALSFGETTVADGLAHDFRLLVQEVTRLHLADTLFTFVTLAEVTQPNGAVKSVDGTNNEAERTLRSPATARDTGRTNKTIRGARRQTVLASVLESLRLYLKTFTLSNVLAELQRWWTTGRSCFAAYAAKLKLSLPEKSVLDELFPNPSG